MKLVYPFADKPEAGRILEIADGVHWLRMPLPMALDHINLYLLEDDDGWWIVDTGMKIGPTKELWEQHFAGAMFKRKPVKAVLCTHMHPDHVGVAGWLCQRLRVPLHMTAAEYFTARAYVKMTADDLSWTSEAYFVGAGLGADYFQRLKERFRGFGFVSELLPGAYRRLHDGDGLTIGGRRWRVLVGRGHSPEHACLYCGEHNILISGDQVIPRITSNVSVGPQEPEGDPLRDWLASHRHFLGQLPADALVLPAHNEPFYGLHIRLRALIAHHERHLQTLLDACREPRTAAELLPVLFKRKLEERQVDLAIGECIAHLNHLRQLGGIRRETADGVHRYKV